MPEDEENPTIDDGENEDIETSEEDTDIDTDE